MNINEEMLKEFQEKLDIATSDLERRELANEYYSKIIK
tara:strand:- start:7153 stop:7266 length:114 start_codon:yes stop_codon:yes gene_type:complete